MDYNSGTELWKHQWDLIHNHRRIALAWRQDEKEGESEEYLALIDDNKGIAPNGKIINKCISLKTGYNISFVIKKDSYYIHGFVLRDSENHKIETYKWNLQKGDYYNETTSIKDSKSIQITYNSSEEYLQTNIYRLVEGHCFYQSTQINYLSGSKDIVISKNQKWGTHFLTNTSGSSINCQEDRRQLILERDRNGCDYEDVEKDLTKLRKSIDDLTPIDATNLINNSCLNALEGLSYGQIQSYIEKISTQEKLKEDSELAILRLIKAINSTDYQQFYIYLESNDNNKLKYFINEINDASFYFWTDKSNYTNFIGALVWMYNKYPESIENRWPSEKDADAFATRVINLEPIEYSNDMDDIFPKFTEKVNKGEYNEAEKIALYDVYNTYKPNAFNGQLTKSSKKEHITDVSLLTPLVIIPKKEPLPLVATALEENGTNNHFYVVPAVFLKYNSDKIRNHNIEKGIITTLDIITIASSGGTALATKVPWIRRAWAMAEVVGAVGNIAVNTDKITDSDIKAVVDIYNGAMGVIGLKNLGKGGYQFVKNLPDKTKKLLQENKGIRILFKDSYLKFKSKFSRFKALGKFDELDNVTKEKLHKQEQILDDLVKEVNSIHKRFTQQQIDEFALKATHIGNGKNKDKVLLGKWEGKEVNTSYQNRAKNEGYTYFDLGDEGWENASNMVNGDRNEMLKINKKFIDNNRNKKFYFSHNSWNAPAGTFRSEEAEYLIDIGLVQKILNKLVIIYGR